MFGSSPSQTLIAAFAAAVNTSLASFGVKTSEIASINILPGSIIADVQGSSAAVTKVKAQSASNDFYVVYNGVKYYLISHPSGSDSQPSSKKT